jgi:predicted nucleic acid-binding protein
LRAVADTSALVHPAKVPAFLSLMRATFEELLVPGAVYQEILKGRPKSRSDVPIITTAIQEGWIKVRKDVKIVEQFQIYLGEGEKEAINLMLEEKSDWLLMDDKLSVNIARAMGLNARYSVYLLPFWVRRKMVDKSKALEMLDLLVQSGYDLRTADYIVMRKLIGTPNHSPVK